MEKTIVELRAINKLEDVLTRTERIEPRIASADKIPSWDGELIIYKSKLINKNNIMGNIRVQVKGHFQEDIDNDCIKHPVYKSDLLNYQIDGGCIFFIVNMKNMDEFSIYYNSFLPYDLKLLLEKFPEGQDSMSIEFMKYPKDNIELEIKIFRSFIHNKTKQVGTVQASFPLSEMTAEKAKDVNRFSFTLFQTGKHLENMFQSAFEMPTYIYADVLSDKISIPVQKVKMEQIITGDFQTNVCLNDKCYYKSIKVRMLVDDEQIIIGKSFVCSIKDGKITFVLKGKLSERIKDLNFLLVVCKNQKSKLKIGKFFYAEFSVKEIMKKQEEYKKILIYLCKIKAALKTLGVKDDLECDLLTEEDEWVIQIIIESVIGGQLLICNNELPLVINLRVANITIPVLTKKENENAYKLTSLFKESNVCIPAASGALISIHLAMKKQDFLLISNMDYGKITKEILEQKYTQELESVVTIFVLNGILAYDENKNQELYEMLLKITKWQVKNNGVDINYLNYFQLLKRKDKFTLEEIDKLTSIKIQTKEIQVKLGVAILLESQIEIRVYWQQLGSEEKKAFKEYPIYNFVRNYLE